MNTKLKTMLFEKQVVLRTRHLANHNKEEKKNLTIKKNTKIKPGT